MFHRRGMNQSAKRHEEILAALSTDARDSRRPSIATTTAPEQKATYQLLGWLENPLFFGRDGDLEAISHELIESTDKQLRIFALVGIAGVGKSQLALRFVYKYREQLDGIFWIPADEPTKLARGFEDIAKELHLIDDGTDVASEIVRRRVLGWFRTTTQSWLLVLDNVRDIHILHNYWPVGGKGRIILTSQDLTAMAQPVTVSRLIEPFNPEDGAAAFLSFLPANVRGEPDAWGNACIISNACGGLPLALHQCASFLKVSNMSIGELSRICSETASLVQPHSLLNTIPGQDYYYSGNLSTIWQRPLADLSKTPSFVLKLLSWLDPDSIPEVLMKSHRQLHEGMREYLSSEADYYLAIKSLQEHGLVNKSTCSGVFIMHRLIQAMVIQSMSTEDRRITFKLTLTLLDAAIPLQENWEQQTGNWDQFGRALPHIQRLESLRRELNIELSPALAHQLGSVLERTGWYLYERGLLDHSLDLLSKAESVAKYAAASLNIDRVVMESLNTLIYDVINDKACIKFAECRFGEAKDLYSKCLALKEATESPSQNELCLLTNNIGNALANMGLLDEAYTWLKKSFDMRQELLALAPEPGIYKDQLARDWGTLAGCLWLMGNYSTAWEYANYSTKLCEEIYPKDDLVLAGCYVVLGNIRKSQKKLEEAKQLQLKSLDIYTQKYSSHYDTALAYHRYGKLLCEEGNVLDAIDYLKRVIRILSDNSHFKAANARSHYYLAELSDSLLSGDGTQDRERAISLYSEQVRISLEEAQGLGLTMKDFDQLISCWQW
ncbi:putative pfs domain-containing protein [Rosellinia necatrix]|uniref:Putative pfs domain-containing protein n=1 Tax=Rosellinia necatrix TaxID=77044 RepID=A0A1S8AB48_ROSNE|nr:putative pfs domain-containing protein [Rosellinia necatrix]